MVQFFGCVGQDRITGFRGVIMGYCRYMTGCNQVYLAATANGNGQIAGGGWFDEQRIVVDHAADRITLPTRPENPGADFDPPATN